MITSAPIYKRDTSVAIRTWYYEVDGNKWRITAGGPGRKPVTSAWTESKGKQGRNDDQQALFEAQAKEASKLKREYRKTEQELNDVMPGPMLAATYEGNVSFPVYSQPKLDGIRALISAKGAFTREGQPHNNVDHILEALAPVFAMDDAITFDGELYNHDLKEDFGKIVSIVRKQNPSDAERTLARETIQYHVYDQFNACHPNSTFGIRRGDLAMVLPEHPSIVRVVTPKVYKLEELDAEYGKLLEAGYEGQMVRLDAPYEFDKRSKSLLKRKEFITAEFKLLAIEEGQGNWAGFAKRVVFILPAGRECGAGIKGTQEEMKALLNAPWFGTKSLVTIRHFTPTPDGMPRFPVAIDFHFGGRND